MFSHAAVTLQKQHSMGGVYGKRNENSQRRKTRL